MNIWSHHVIGNQLEKLASIFAGLEPRDELSAAGARADVLQCMDALRTHPAQSVALKMLAAMKSSADAGDRKRLEAQSAALRCLIDHDNAVDLTRSDNLRAFNVAHADISDYASNGM